MPTVWPWLVFLGVFSLAVIRHYWNALEYAGGEEGSECPPLDEVPWLERDGYGLTGADLQRLEAEVKAEVKR